MLKEIGKFDAFTEMLILVGFIASLLCLMQLQVAGITKTQSCFVLITVTPNGLITPII